METDRTQLSDRTWLEEQLKRVEKQCRHAAGNLLEAKATLDERHAADSAVDPRVTARLEGSVMRLKRRQAELEHERAVLQASLDPDQPFRWQVPCPSAALALM